MRRCCIHLKSRQISAVISRLRSQQRLINNSSFAYKDLTFLTESGSQKSPESQKLRIKIFEGRSICRSLGKGVVSVGRSVCRSLGKGAVSDSCPSHFMNIVKGSMRAKRSELLQT